MKLKILKHRFKKWWLGLDPAVEAWLIIATIIVAWTVFLVTVVR